MERLYNTCMYKVVFRMNCCTVYIYNVAVIHVLYVIDKSGIEVLKAVKAVPYIHVCIFKQIFYYKKCS